MLKCIKQTVRATEIKYQYNLWRIQVLNKYYKHPTRSPTGCENNEKKETEKTKILWRKGIKVYWDQEKLSIRSQEGQPNNLQVCYRCYWKGNEDTFRIKKWLEQQKG